MKAILVWLESKIYENYGPATLASTEPCVINSSGVNTVSVTKSTCSGTDTDQQSTHDKLILIIRWTT